MKDDPKAKSSGHFAIAACLLVLLPILYVLSIGPAVWLHQRGYISDKVGMTLYAPVQWIMDNCRSFNDAIGWYIRFWV